MTKEKHKTLFLDIETTGLTPHRMVPGKRVGIMKKQYLHYETDYMEFPYIVSMAWAIDDNDPVYYIFNQEGREVPKEASGIHGITAEIAAESEYTFNHGVLEMLNGEVNCHDAEIVVGHGLYFDTSIIKANILREINLKRPKYPLTTEPFDYISEIFHKYKRIDTMRSSAKMMRKWPTLSELHLKIFRSGFECHNAKNDVEATRRCYKWLLKKGIVPTFDELQNKAKEKEEKEKELALNVQ